MRTRNHTATAVRIASAGRSVVAGGRQGATWRAQCPDCAYKSSPGSKATADRYADTHNATAEPVEVAENPYAVGDTVSADYLDEPVVGKVITVYPESVDVEVETYGRTVVIGRKVAQVAPVR